MARKRRVLFLCTGNCIRSQMAEGILRSLAGDRYESLSAGARPAGWVHPLAVQVMDEIGVDISGQRSKHIERFLSDKGGEPPDVIVTVCDLAARGCPAFPGEVVRYHWPFYDPIVEVGTDEDKLPVFRRVRDEIRVRLGKALEDDAFD